MDYQGMSSQFSQAIGSLPLGQMLKSIAVSVVEAQSEMDRLMLESTIQRSRETVTINGTEYNLLELGLVPSFYFFNDVTIEIAVSLTMHAEETTAIGSTTSIGVTHSTASNTNLSPGPTAAPGVSPSPGPATTPTPAPRGGPPATSAATSAPTSTP